MSPDATFDYVIAGAGSAGCVLAARLTEDPATTVCLIEAGPPDRNPLIHVPLGIVFLMNHKRLNWRYNTVAQAHANGRSIYIPRGKALGGSSSINGLIYIRGHRLDYDDWAAQGNRGWSYAEVLPYFRKSENNEIWRDSPYHGTGGPLNVTNFQSNSVMSEVFFQAAESLQYRRCADFSGADQEGFGYRQANIRDGRRESAATAFLNPAKSRDNLKVITGALVARVVWDGRRATGVQYQKGGRTRRVAARGEVILAAGVIGSPTVLQRSGVGDGPALMRHGIDVVLDAPAVGRNLQDHVATAVQFTSPSDAPYGLSLRAAPRLAWNLIEYLLFRRGLLANTALQCSGFVKTEPGLDRPDVQLIFMPGLRTPDGNMALGHGYGVVPILLRPRSRGEVVIADADPASHPRIDPRFFWEGHDLDILRRAVKIGRRLLDSPHFDPYRGKELLPGPAVRSDEDLADFIRDTAATVFHPVGTCRMGSDAGGVVDPELRVRGIEALRVVDASVMPTLIGGNTNAPTIMIAEKAADMIRGRPPLPAAEGV